MSKELHEETIEMFLGAARQNPAEQIDADVQSGLGILFNLSGNKRTCILQGDPSPGEPGLGGLLIWGVPPSCPAAQPVLPISHQPRQNQAEGGTAKIQVNPTEVRHVSFFCVWQLQNSASGARNI